MVSKLFSAASLAVILPICFTTLGSVSLANNLRASSLLFLAFAKLTSGYTPIARSFSLPAKRYLKRQYFAPFGITKRNKPFSSASLYALSRGFTLRSLVSVSGIGGICVLGLRS